MSDPAAITDVVKSVAQSIGSEYPPQAPPPLPAGVIASGTTEVG